MKTILLVVVGFTVLVSLLLLLYKAFIKRKTLKLILKKYASVNPLIEKLKNSQPVSNEEIFRMSSDPSLRLAVFQIMQAHKTLHLFPQEYLTCEKGAESYLVNWLEFPTELGKAPDQIELLIKITLDETLMLDYYVFKFIVNSPPWSAQAWMLGTCGPYYKRSSPYDIPARIFSRFNTVGSVTPESEALWVHQNI